MYRVYILFLLAIGLPIFAVDSSLSILQAKKISDTSLTLSWHPIQDATKYKILYDESDLLDPLSPNLLLDTDFMTLTEWTITKLAPSTEYTLMVHGYTAEGKKIGQTLPLHVRTARTPPQMNVVREPFFVNATTIEIAFSQPINESVVDVTVTHPKNKKILTLASKKTSPEDMRILILTLSTPIELGLPYEIILKKIVSLDGVELPPENRIPMKLVYQWELPVGISGVVPSPLPVIPEQIIEPEKTFAEPVPIDALPKTGPSLIWIALMSAGILVFSRKLLKKV